MNIINLGNELFANYIIKFDGGYILVDAGYNTNFADFKKRIAKYNIDIKSIKYIFLTHVHSDHVAYLAELLQETNVILLMHSKAKERLLLGQNVLGRNSSYLSKFVSFVSRITGQSVKPFMPFAAEGKAVFCEDSPDYLKNLGYPFAIIPLTGHTPDSIGLITDDGELFCGDAAMNGFPSINKNTLLIEDIEQYKKTRQAMTKLKVKTIYPGHGKPFSIEDFIKSQKKDSKIMLR